MCILIQLVKRYLVVWVIDSFTNTFFTITPYVGARLQRLIRIGMDISQIRFSKKCLDLNARCFIALIEFFGAIESLSLSRHVGITHLYPSYDCNTRTCRTFIIVLINSLRDICNIISNSDLSVKLLQNAFELAWSIEGWSEKRKSSIIRFVSVFTLLQCAADCQEE